MLFWVNTHGLFVLGIFLSGSYWISLLIRDRKIHLKFLLWMVLSVIACLANPYFMRGITFPVELITRFDAQNIFHQHIRELKSFWLLDQFVLKDLLFIGFAGITMLMTILTIGKRKVHEFILLAVFLYMALVAVRNLGLFIVISIPILGASLRDLKDLIKKNQPASVLVARSRVLKIILFVLLILIPLGLIPRVWTNNYYISNHSYSKTGTGIDPDHQPVMVSEFLTRHKLDGRLLNSIAFGGWLSWSLPQPVFIDGRLEVMTEPLYQEVVDSWDWGLNRLVKKYQPEMIVYNYVKYYPWTVQLAADPGWRVIYLDGFAAVFVKKDYVPELPSVNFRNLPASCGLTPEMTNEQENKILQASPEGTFKTWFSGFYKKNNENIANFQNIASFCLQLKQDSIAERFFIESLRLSENRNTSVYYALADIYREQGENEKAGICYTRILSFDPGNETVFNALTSLNQISPVVPEKGSRVEAEARAFYNSGNQKYRYGDVEGALFDYSKAIAIKPDYFKAYNNRGIAKALGLKKYKDAIEDFNKAIGIKPDYADAWLGRGTAKYNMNDPAGACSDWEKARALGSRQAEDMILQYCKK
jgi:tetratricopeptide (TPR) repeat protein